MENYDAIMDVIESTQRELEILRGHLKTLRQLQKTTKGKAAKKIYNEIEDTIVLIEKLNAHLDDLSKML